MGDAAVKMEVSGMDELVEQMGKMQQLTGDVAKTMLRAGGNVMQREWINEIERLNHIRTHDMVNSISTSNPKNKGQGLEIETYPKGTGKKGVRNTVKAFVLNNGREGKRPIKADHFVEKISEKAEKETTETMADVWGKFIATGAVPNVKKLSKGKK